MCWLGIEERDKSPNLIFVFGGPSTLELGCDLPKCFFLYNFLASSPLGETERLEKTGVKSMFFPHGSGIRLQ